MINESAQVAEVLQYYNKSSASASRQIKTNIFTTHDVIILWPLPRVRWLVSGTGPRDTRQCYYVLFWPFSVQWLVPSPGNNQIVSSLRYTNTRHTRLTFSMLIEYSWPRSPRYYLNSFHYTVKLQPNPQANYCLIPTDFLPPRLVVCQMKLNWSILSLSYLLIVQYTFIVYMFIQMI